MALTDWEVEVFDLAPRKNSAKNPYTGLPIDPDGITQSLFTMRLTNTVTGKVLERADLIGRPSKEALVKYATDIIDGIESNVTLQKTDNNPSPLVGKLNIIPNAPVVAEKTDLEKARESFQDLDNQYTSFKALVDSLGLAPDGDNATALNAMLSTKKQSRDIAASVLAQAIIASA